MPFYRIPLPTEPHTTQRTTLGDTPFLLSFDWNGRAERWHLSVLTDDGQPLLESARLVVGIDLIRNLTHRDRPLGVLFLESIDADDPKSLEALKSCQLWFLGEE